jgi:predicted dehydrogenase
MGVQISELDLYGIRHGREMNWLKLPVPLEPPGAAAEWTNVARLYATLAEDIRSGTRRTPGFAAGVRLHRLLDTVRLSAETGKRQSRQL